MSRRDLPDHELRLRILAALGMTHRASDRPQALTMAATLLRSQGLRVKTEEMEDVLAMTLGDILFPSCTCGQAFLFDGGDPGTYGPHHGARCPRWRAVRG